MNFKDLGINEDILRALDKLGFQEPTPIQEKSIPSLLAGKIDYIGLAQTGTGKTAAFGIPLISHIDTKKRAPQAIILCPTRELCLQITKELKSYAAFTSYLEIVAIYGGASVVEQISALRRGPQIVVGTPGRVIDLINRKVLQLGGINTVVLDEADEMLNMGFQEDIDTILASTSTERNTWLFSATMPNMVEKIANNYMKTPLRVTVGSRNGSARNIAHHYCLVRRENHYDAIKRFIDCSPNFFGMLFCRTKRDAKEISDRLAKDGYRTEALHGDLSQTQRDSIMAKFRARQIQLLVATDVAARGIDVNDITHVIHHNIPEDIEVYTHRSGRTARAGKSGMSLAIITSSRDLRKIRMIEQQVGQSVTALTVPSGADVHQKQIEYLTQTIRDVVINTDNAQLALNTLMEKLSDLSPQEILAKLFVLHVGQKVIGVQKLPDLNAPVNDRRSDDSGAYNNEPYQQRQYSSGPGNITLQFNAGRDQGMDKSRLLSFVCTNANIQGRSLGKIDIQRNASFLSLDDEQIAQKILAGLKGLMFNDNKITVDKMSGEQPKRPTENRRFNRPSSSRSSGDSRSNYSSSRY